MLHARQHAPCHHVGTAGHAQSNSQREVDAISQSVPTSSSGTGYHPTDMHSRANFSTPNPSGKRPLFAADTPAYVAPSSNDAEGGSGGAVGSRLKRKGDQKVGQRCGSAVRSLRARLRLSPFVQTEEIQIKVKKTRAAPFKETNLVSSKGVWAIADDFPKLHLKGRGSEA